MDQKKGPNKDKSSETQGDDHTVVDRLYEEFLQTLTDEEKEYYALMDEKYVRRTLESLGVHRHEKNK